MATRDCGDGSGARRRTAARAGAGALVLALIVPLAAACAATPSAAPTSSGTSSPAGSPGSAKGSVPGTPPRTGTRASGRETDGQATGTVPDDGTSTSPTTVEQADGASVPIVLKSFTNGYQKPTVLVSVGGGAAVPVLLDTGSTGLHLLATNAGRAVTNSSTAVTETYADGSQYSGTLASATVSIGGVATAAPIDLVLINTVSCTSSSPSCPTPDAQAMITNNGVYGTMGVSLAPSTGCASPIYSPLLQLPGGSDGYSVGFGANGSGTIVLGNTPPATGGTAVPVQASAYSVTEAGSCTASGTQATYPNGAGAWDTSTANLCWSVAGAMPVCGRTTFDTGSESAGVGIGSFPGAPTTGTELTSGTSVVLTAPGQTAPLWTLAAGTTPGANRVATSSPASYLIGTTGGAFFFSGWVTFDAKNGNLVVTPTR